MRGHGRSAECLVHELPGSIRILDARRSITSDLEILLRDGVEVVRPPVIDEHSWRLGMYYPRLVSRDADALRARLMTERRDFDPGATIVLFDLDDASFAEISSEGVDVKPPTKELSELAKGHKLPKVTRILAEALQREFLEPCPFVSTALNYTSPGCRSTTFDHKEGRLCGLHFDNFQDRLAGHDLASVCDNARTSLRVGFNCGRESRAFVFDTLTLAEVASTVRTRVPAPLFERVFQGSTPYRLADLYFSSAPSHLFVELRIPVGCGYIAPTPNFIHDGSTLGKAWLDANLLVSFKGAQYRPFAANPRLQPEKTDADTSRSRPSDALL